MHKAWPPQLFTQARVLQPGISSRGTHHQRMTHSSCVMALARRHRVHLVWVNQSHLRLGTGSDRPDRTLLEREGGVSSRASPQVQSKPSGLVGQLRGVPLPVQPEGGQAHNHEAPQSLTPLVLAPKEWEVHADPVIATSLLAGLCLFLGGHPLCEPNAAPQAVVVSAGKAAQAALHAPAHGNTDKPLGTREHIK